MTKLNIDRNQSTLLRCRNCCTNTCTRKNFAEIKNCCLCAEVKNIRQFEELKLTNLCSSCKDIFSDPHSNP